MTKDKLKVYVITGATSGIGLALVSELVKNPANKIFAGYRNETKIENLKKVSDDIIPFYINMEDRDSIKNAAEFIKSKTDKIDTLVNAAGCVIAGAMESLDVSRLEEQFRVNTFSHLDFSQKLLDELEGGRIINISSMASFGIFPFVAPYCASKRALDILFNGIALESGRNIKVISIKPGVIATPLWEKSIELNKSTIENCKNYDKEMKYMVANAQKNGEKGLSVDEVIRVILKADSAKNPKISYTVGKDAGVAQAISRLPFGLQNKLIKLGLKIKLSK